MSAIRVPALYVNRLSQLWIRKQLTYFRLYDSGRSGVLTEHKLREVFDQRARSHFPVEKLTVLEPIIQHSWRILSSTARQTQTSQVDLDQFLHNRFCCVTEAADEERRQLTEMSSALLAAGELSLGMEDEGLPPADVMHLLALYGVNAKDAKTSVKVLDSNRDGVVSQSEFQLALTKFFLSPDKDESSMMFGHLAWDDIEPDDDIHVAV